MIKRYCEHSMRDLGPQSIMFPELGQGLHSDFSLIGKDATGANGFRKCVVALADQMRQF